MVVLVVPWWCLGGRISADIRLRIGAPPDPSVAGIGRSRQNPQQKRLVVKRMAKATAWRRRALGALAAVGLLGGQGLPAQACTSFVLQGSDGGRVYGRTMEFGQPLNSQAVLIQRGTPLRGNGPDGKIGNGLAWSSRYAVVGLNALGLKDIVPDGMNEKGLAGGLLYFAGYAKFQAVPAGQTQRSINSAQLLT